MGGMQDADLTVGLHVLTAAVPEGYDGAEFHLDLLDKINRCLHGFGGESWGSFKRSASIPCHDHEEILDDTEVFQAVVYDTSSMKKLVKCPVSPGMSIRTK